MVLTPYHLLEARAHASAWAEEERKRAAARRTQPPPIPLPSEDVDMSEFDNTDEITKVVPENRLEVLINRCR